MKTKLFLGALLSSLPGPVKDSLAARMKSAGLKEDAEVKRAACTVDKDMSTDAAKRTVKMYASTRHVDRDREVVVPSGWDLSEFIKAPVHLWGHNYSLPPIGTDIEIAADAYGLKSTTVYADTGAGTLPETCFQLRRQGMLKTSSVGFIPLERAWRGDAVFNMLVEKFRREWQEFDEAAAEKCEVITTKALLLEHSDVSVPANVNALTLEAAKSAGADPKVIRELGFERMVKDLAEVYGLKGLEDIVPPAEPGASDGTKQKDGEADDMTVKVISAGPVVRIVKGPEAFRVVRRPEDIVKETLDLSMGRV